MERTRCEWVRENAPMKKCRFTAAIWYRVRPIQYTTRQSVDNFSISIQNTQTNNELFSDSVNANNVRISRNWRANIHSDCWDYKQKIKGNLFKWNINFANAINYPAKRYSEQIRTYSIPTKKRQRERNKNSCSTFELRVWLGMRVHTTI